MLQIRYYKYSILMIF